MNKLEGGWSEMNFKLAVLAALVFNEIRAADPSRIRAIDPSMLKPRQVTKIKPGVLVETNGVLVYRSSRAFAPNVLDENPFRKIGGQIFDLTPLFQKIDQSNVQSDGSWSVYTATVFQVIPDGLLLRPDSRYGNLYLLRNHPFQSVLTDGSSVNFIARSSSPYQYTDVQNAVRTIDSVDYGEEPNTREWEQIIMHWKKSVEASNRKKLEEASEAEERARTKQRESEAKVVQLLEERVQKGSIDAAIELADRYASGKGVEKDPDKSAQLRELAEKRKLEKK